MRKTIIAAAAGVLAMPFAGLIVAAPANAAPCANGATFAHGTVQDCLACEHAHPATAFQDCFDPVQPAPVPAAGPGPGRNQHCNDLLANAGGNDFSGVYKACCFDAIAAGQTPC